MTRMPVRWMCEMHMMCCGVACDRHRGSCFDPQAKASPFLNTNLLFQSSGFTVVVFNCMLCIASQYLPYSGTLLLLCDGRPARAMEPCDERPLQSTGECAPSSVLCGLCGPNTVLRSPTTHRAVLFSESAPLKSEDWHVP